MLESISMVSYYMVKTWNDVNSCSNWFFCVFFFCCCVFCVFHTFLKIRGKYNDVIFEPGDHWLTSVYMRWKLRNIFQREWWWISGIVVCIYHMNIQEKSCVKNSDLFLPHQAYLWQTSIVFSIYIWTMYVSNSYILKIMNSFCICLLTSCMKSNWCPFSQMPSVFSSNFLPFIVYVLIFLSYAGAVSTLPSGVSRILFISL